jgi:hypothetical protein
MTKNKWLWFLLTSLFLLDPLRGQEEEIIREAVSVINVEVPVRVFFHGQSVPGLVKDEFQIFEDRKPQTINGFYALHKQMKSAAAGPATEQRMPGRYFVLVFRIYDCNRQLENGVVKLFNDIFLPDDQVLVMANTQVQFFERLGDDDQAQAKILELLKNESRKAFNQMLATLTSIERVVNISKFKMTLRDAQTKIQIDKGILQDYIKGFLQTYLDAWREFKRLYLALDIDKYYYFSRHLEKVKREKWVLNFYQLEMFPQIAINSDIERSLSNFLDSLRSSEDPTASAYVSMITQLLNDIRKEMNVSNSFPAEEVSKLFYKVNATFHSFFIRTFKDTDNSELQFKNVATDIENSLRDLTRKTGGELLASADLQQSLDTLALKTDDYYMLTYEPANPKKVGKIKVEVKNQKYDVLYDNNIRADYINEYLQRKEAETPSVKIRGLVFKNKKLSFSIEDFSQTKIKGETLGMLTVRIRIKNSQEQIFLDQSKSLQASKKPLSLSLGFNSLSAGKYDIIVDVLDQVSDKSCTEVIQPLLD